MSDSLYLMMISSNFSNQYPLCLSNLFLRVMKAWFHSDSSLQRHVESLYFNVLIGLKLQVRNISELDWIQIGYIKTNMASHTWTSNMSAVILLERIYNYARVQITNHCQSSCLLVFFLICAVGRHTSLLIRHIQS